MRKTIFISLIALLLVSCKDETKVTGISLNPSTMTMSVGETKQIELLIEPISSQIYNQKYWSSSDKSVATVDESGNVTAVYVGTCTITATVGDFKATCKITVESPQYDLKMKNAAVYMTGLDSETGVMNQVLRLYDEGLSMDSAGTVTGNGLMLHLALCSPATTDTLSVGKYTISETRTEYTIRPGELREEGGKYYVNGSFLGQYSDNGLTVLLLTGGDADINSTEDGFSVVTALTGDYGEQVNVKWNGTPVKYRSDTTILPESFSYTSVEIIDTTIAAETTTKHTFVRLKSGLQTLNLMFRVPLTASTQLVSGRYSLSENDQPYTISESESSFSNDTEDIDLQSATISVSCVEGVWVFSGTIVTEDNKSYTIGQGEKKENISPRKRRSIEKFFVTLQP